MSAKLNLYFKGGKFFKNPSVYMTLDEVEVEGELKASGFEIEMPIEEGRHELFMKFGIMKQSFVFDIDSDETADYELHYSRLWGRFKMKPRVL